MDRLIRIHREKRIMMSNRFFDAQQSKNNRYFTYNNLDGLNSKGSGQSKIHIMGQLDHFTKKTLYENYDIIAQNLKVYPTIRIYPRGYEFDGGFSGFYHSSDNHIDMIDHYYMISILSHEMRHAYQYIYLPDLFFNTAYSSAREYLNCRIERDARGYSIDYCIAREYWEEAEHCKEEEEQNELVIQNKLPPSEVGLNDHYFKQNPTEASMVVRTYHWDQNSQTEKIVPIDSVNEKSEILTGCLVLMILAAAVIYFLVKFVF